MIIGPPLKFHGTRDILALCNDGTHSFAAHHQGTSLRHGIAAVFCKENLAAVSLAVSSPLSRCSICVVRVGSLLLRCARCPGR
jgi:hypothetical protein